VILDNALTLVTPATTAATDSTGQIDPIFRACVILAKAVRFRPC
jgi:hypothetical protein